MARRPDVSRDTFQPKKDYIGLIFQQKRPLLDAELNELQDVVRAKVEEAISVTLLNGPLSDSFDLSIDPTNLARVLIKQGAFYYYGRQLNVREDIAFTLPTMGSTTELWTVYLEAWFDYVDETQDPELKDPNLPPTAWRLKQYAEVKICSGTLLPWTTNGHISFPLWVIKRVAGEGDAVKPENVADQRSLSTVNYVVSGAKVARVGPLTFQWEDGDILLYGQNKHVPTGTLDMVPNATRILYVDKDMKLILEEFPVVNRAIVPLARIITDASSIIEIDDLRPYWAPKEFPAFEDEYAERNYPFRKHATLQNDLGKIIPKNFVRDLRISNAQYNAAYFVSRIVGSTVSPVIELYVSNDHTVQQLLFTIPVTSPMPKDGLVTVQAYNTVTGESGVGIFDLHAICGLFEGPDLEDNLFTADQAAILDTLVRAAQAGTGTSPFINNWREENLLRDYPIRGSSVWLRKHVWDALLNCARDREVGYFISTVHLNHTDADYMEVSSYRYLDATTQVVARLERLGTGSLAETWITQVKYSIYGEVAKVNAYFGDIVDPTHKCFSYEEAKFFDGVLISCKEFGNFCMGDACIDVRIVGSSRGFGGPNPPIPILIDSTCYPVMVSVAFSEICCCEAKPNPYYYYYYPPYLEDCVEICPGARDCGIWYLQYRQTGKRQDRIIRIQYAYVGIICETLETPFRLSVYVDEVCGNCYTFSYTVFAPNRTVVSQLWDFGDGKTSTELSPQHTYDVAGSYVVTLTVTLDNGIVLTETMQIMV